MRFLQLLKFFIAFLSFYYFSFNIPFFYLILGELIGVFVLFNVKSNNGEPKYKWRQICLDNSLGERSELN